MTGEKRTEAIDVERALFDPASVFVSPEALLDHPDLSIDQKIEILRRWEYDAAEVAVAVEEGMPNGEDDLLRRILLALERLSSIDPDKVSPTKQHGLSRLAVRSKSAR
jgi:hypothetical protein